MCQGDIFTIYGDRQWQLNRYVSDSDVKIFVEFGVRIANISRLHTDIVHIISASICRCFKIWRSVELQHPGKGNAEKAIIRSGCWYTPKHRSMALPLLKLPLYLLQWYFLPRWLKYR